MFCVAASEEESGVRDFFMTSYGICEDCSAEGEELCVKCRRSVNKSNYKDVRILDDVLDLAGFPISNKGRLEKIHEVLLFFVVLILQLKFKILNSDILNGIFFFFVAVCIQIYKEIVSSRFKNLGSVVLLGFLGYWMFNINEDITVMKVLYFVRFLVFPDGALRSIELWIVHSVTIISLCVFIFMEYVLNGKQRVRMTRKFSLSLKNLQESRFYTFLTFHFLHDGVVHYGFNLFMWCILALLPVSSTLSGDDREHLHGILDYVDLVLVLFLTTVFSSLFCLLENYVIFIYRKCPSDKRNEYVIGTVGLSGTIYALLTIIFLRIGGELTSLWFKMVFGDLAALLFFNILFCGVIIGARSPYGATVHLGGVTAGLSVIGIRKLL